MSALVLAGAGSVTLSVDKTATDKRDEALTFARIVTAVSDDTLEAAVESLRELKGIAAEVEESRVAIKRPIDAIAKQIQETARTFLVDVNQQIERIDALIDAHQKAKAQKARDEAAEIERKRLAEEKHQRDEAAAHEKARLDAIAANQPPPPPPTPKPKPAFTFQPVMAMGSAPSKPKGLVSKREPRYRVEDRTKLAVAKPEWVTVEPKGKLILDHVRILGEFDGEKTVAEGLVAYWEDTSSVRA